MQGNTYCVFFQNVPKCYVSDGLVSIQDLELGSHVDGFSSSKSLCKSLQKNVFFYTISRLNTVSFVCVCVRREGGRGLCLEGSLRWNMDI